MTTRVYATLDPNSLGPGLLLDAGNMVVSTTTDALDNHRKACGTVPKSANDSYFECHFWSVARTSLAGMIAVGVAQNLSSLSKAVGEDNLSFGYWPADGAVKSNNANVATCPVVNERVCIGVLLHLSTPGSEQVVFSVDGNQVAVASLPAGKFWLPAMTVSGGNAGEVQAVVNFGIDAFDNQPAPIV